MMAGLMHPKLEPGDSEWLIAGVTVPLVATLCSAEMMPARALTFNTGNLGCLLSTLSSL